MDVWVWSRFGSMCKLTVGLDEVSGLMQRAGVAVIPTCNNVFSTCNGSIIYENGEFGS